ncbi:MAG: DNA repair protein RadC [Stellaceae bacterium]
MAGAIPHFYGHRQRLRQRLIAGGPDNLPDYELLEVILFAGNPRGDVKPLAKDLIDRFGSFAEVLSAGSDDLLGFPGLGEAGVAALKAVREAALRLMRAELRERPLLGSWDRLIDYCTANIAHGRVEEFHLLFLDRKNMLIAHERQQRGTIDHTPVYPREVVKRALELSASALILVHKSPTRNPTQLLSTSSRFAKVQITAQDRRNRVAISVGPSGRHRRSRPGYRLAADLRSRPQDCAGDAPAKRCGDSDKTSAIIAGIPAPLQICIEAAITR